MTLPRLYALNRYWKNHPPTHLLVAGYLGYRQPAEAEAKPKDLGSADELINCFMAAGGRVINV